MKTPRIDIYTKSSPHALGVKLVITMPGKESAEEAFDASNIEELTEGAYLLGKHLGIEHLREHEQVAEVLTLELRKWEEKHLSPEVVQARRNAVAETQLGSIFDFVTVNKDLTNTPPKKSVVSPKGWDEILAWVEDRLKELDEEADEEFEQQKMAAKIALQDFAQNEHYRTGMPLIVTDIEAAKKLIRCGNVFLIEQPKDNETDPEIFDRAIFEAWKELTQ